MHIYDKMCLETCFLNIVITCVMYLTCFIYYALKSQLVIIKMWGEMNYIHTQPNNLPLFDDGNIKFIWNWKFSMKCDFKHFHFLLFILVKDLWTFLVTFENWTHEKHNVTKDKLFSHRGQAAWQAFITFTFIQKICNHI